MTGRITTYPGQSKYQIVIETLEPAGVGALMALLEERKKKLAAEGLFDAARKQLLPFLPKVIGVITSPTGAVIRDILHRLSDRFPRQVLVWPVKVQGEGSAEQVAAAINGFNAFPFGRIARPDVIIVARGGGSLEDLWSFNEEIVVRAAAASMIPLISAVGHETDITLIDFVSDKRAPTPSAAAEMAVPVRADLITRISALHNRQVACWQRGIENRRKELRSLARALPGLEDLFALPRQRLDTVDRALSAGPAGHDARAGTTVWWGCLRASAPACGPIPRRIAPTSRMTAIGLRSCKAAQGWRWTICSIAATRGWNAPGSSWLPSPIAAYSRAVLPSCAAAKASHCATPRRLLPGNVSTLNLPTDVWGLWRKARARSNKPPPIRRRRRTAVDPGQGSLF